MRQGLLPPSSFAARLASLAHRARRITAGRRGRAGVVLACLTLIVMALGGCNLPLLPSASTSAIRPTATPIPPLAAHKGDASAQELASLSPSATQCSQVSGFESASTASAGSGFADVPFPPQSVSTVVSAAANLYTFAMVSACTSSGEAQSILAFYAQQMVASGWKQSATYPYGGDPTHACGDTYCWRKADKTVRYVSLEQMTSSDLLTIYVLRIATAPAPTAALVLHSPSSAARPGGTATVSASCQAGEQMLGGGFSINSGRGLTARSSYPSAADTWTASAVDTGSSPIDLQVYVVCLQANYSLGMQIIQAPFDTSAGAPQATPAICTNGVVTGGGAQISSNSAVLAESAPEDDGKSWNVVAASGANGAKGTAYALCASRSVDVQPSTKRTFTIESGNDTQANLACLTGQWLTSGGYSNADPSADGKNVFALDAPTAGDSPDNWRWFLDGYNLDASSAHGATIWVTCVQPDPQF